MKAKTFFVGIIALTLSVILPSCGAIQGPDTWAVEIEDSYRTQLSVTFAYAKYDEKVIEEFAERLDEEAQKIYDDKDLLDDNCAMYKLALEKMAKDEEIAADILEVYSLWDVKFSKWEKQPKQGGFSIWTAKEENSDVKVTFKNNKLLEWELELDEESLTVFIENIVASIVGETSVYDEDEIEDAISKRIEAQYEDRMPDDKIMSKTFYSIFKKAQDADDSELGWPDWDYWEWTQGAYAAISSIDVDVISPKNATAHVVLSYPEIKDGHITKLDMPMVYEDNNWYVDDIIHYEDDGSKYSLKNAANGE